MEKIMDISSLARKTDIMYNKQFSEIINKDNYVVIKSPKSPNYHWGNYIIYDSPPQLGDLKKWQKQFHEEFEYYDVENPSHYLFTWNPSMKSDGNFSEFLKAGYELDKGIALTAQTLIKSKKHNDSLRVKKITSLEEWEQATVNRALGADEKYFSSFEASYEFAKERMTEFKEYIQNGSGSGDWFGAFMGQQLVGGLGIYFDGDIGRFQMVSTHHEHRRKGVCSTLVYEAAKTAFAEYKVKTLVMEADADYHAAKIYESVGFKPTEVNQALTWWKQPSI